MGIGCVYMLLSVTPSDLVNIAPLWSSILFAQNLLIYCSAQYPWTLNNGVALGSPHAVRSNLRAVLGFPQALVSSIPS